MATIKKTAVKKVTVKKNVAATPAAEATPITGEPKAKKEKVVKISKYKGATTGMRVMEFQDMTFQENYKAMLTDEELAAKWHAEFPNAVNFTVNHVGGARRDFNNGTHAKATPRPATPLAKVIVDANGKKRFVTDEESAAEKAAKVAAKVEKTKETKAKKVSKAS